MPCFSRCQKAKSLDALQLVSSYLRQLRLPRSVRTSRALRRRRCAGRYAQGPPAPGIPPPGTPPPSPATAARFRGVSRLVSRGVSPFEKRGGVLGNINTALPTVRRAFSARLRLEFDSLQETPDSVHLQQKPLYRFVSSLGAVLLCLRDITVSSGGETSIVWHPENACSQRRRWSVREVCRRVERARRRLGTPSTGARRRMRCSCDKIKDTSE